MELNLRKRFHKLWHKVNDVPKIAGLTEDQAELMAKLDLGIRLREIVNTPGWKDVRKIMEDIAFSAVYSLVNYQGVDKEELAAYHRRARAMSEFYDQLILQIDDALDAAEKVPQIFAASPSGNQRTDYEL